MPYYQFSFSEISEEKAELLVALLDNIGFEGFEQTENELIAFIQKAQLNNETFENIIFQMKVNYIKSEIEDTNWNKEWESNFQPLTILYPETNKPFCHIRANFHPVSNEAEYEIIITPKMSFGTGHHATTALMIEQMALLKFTGKSVIDFGTGTGVLAILAEKLGAVKIVAIDHDDWSMNNARENVGANNCLKIKCIKGETTLSDFKADIILANINLNVILSNLKDLKESCSKEAVILFSGILIEDESTLANALESNEFTINYINKKTGWALVNASV